MKSKILLLCSAIVVLCAVPALAQTAGLLKADPIAILKAEDERRYDETLETYLNGKYDEASTVRALLAAGRIGDERAVEAVTKWLDSPCGKPAEMAAFALGEIESIKAAGMVLKALGDEKTCPAVLARAVEAAGKIAAANAKDEGSKELGNAIVMTLKNAVGREVTLLSLTAALRARPSFLVPEAAAKYLTHSDSRVRADAANTLARVRARTAKETLRTILMRDPDPIARANAARALGSAEAKEALDALTAAATRESDMRVRISAIRALVNLKDVKIAHALVARGEILFDTLKKSGSDNPAEKNELLEIAAALGNVLTNTNNEKAVNLLKQFRETDRFRSPETEIAFAQIAPKLYVNLPTFEVPLDNGFGMGFLSAAGVTYYGNQYPDALGNFAQGFAAIADNNSVDKETSEKARKYVSILAAGVPVAMIFSNPEALLLMHGKPSSEMSEEAKSKLIEENRKFEKLKKGFINAFPHVLRALSKFKPERYKRTVAEFLLNKPVVVVPSTNGKMVAFAIEPQGNEVKEREFYLLHKDPVVRATAAELVGQMTDINWYSALQSAFDFSLTEDRELNDAQLAILDSAPKHRQILEKALASPDAIVRQKAIQLIKNNDELQKTISVSHEKEIVKPFASGQGTKLGQTLSDEPDYERALSRNNEQVYATVTTEKGDFTIALLPEDAPLTVDNFIKLARANYFNGLEVHRVVPNFVMQDGDPRGDGNGGPGWSIRCEINMVPFERGAVGMALSGKDTGGSQWFVTHSPQPHLDGGYTVFGRVNEAGMKVVDNIVRGDKILKVVIVESGKTARIRR